MSAAKADLSKGYTRIANDLLQAIYCSKMDGREIKILLLLARLTYGYQRKHVVLTLGDIAKATGIDRAHASRCLRALLQGNLVLASPHGYAINTRLDTWGVLPKWQHRSAEEPFADDVSGGKVLPKRQHPEAQGVAKMATGGVAKMATKVLPKWQQHAPDQPDSVGIVGPPKERKKHGKETPTTMGASMSPTMAGGGGGFFEISWLPEIQGKTLIVRALKTLHVSHPDKLTAKARASMAEILALDPPADPTEWGLTILQVLGDTAAAVAAEKIADPNAIKNIPAVTLYRAQQQLLALAIEPNDEEDL